MMVYQVIARVFNEWRALVAVMFLQMAFALYPNTHKDEKILLARALEGFARNAADGIDKAKCQ